MSDPGLSSALYRGKLRHCRLSPKPHRFQYDVFMVYLDTAELEQVFQRSRLWSMNHLAPVRLRRRDFIGPYDVPIETAVRQRIWEETGKTFDGPVRMLANLRYWGFLMNPIVCYFCFDEQEQLQFIVAEVTNTPWKEKHSYVLPCHPNKPVQRIRFQKDLHVSPFNTMDVRYLWQSNQPGPRLSIRLTNYRDGEREFFATLNMQRYSMTAKSMARILVDYPWMTMKVFLGIYWQAIKLFIKGVPLQNHPARRAGTNRTG